MQRTFSFNSLFFAASMLLMISCSVNKQIGKLAKLDILNDSNFAPAHVGISLYDASEKKYVYNYQGDKYFIPASNTKLLTCYAAMKYLGDSLVGGYLDERKDSIYFLPSGDPTFLHPDFINQRLFDYLKRSGKEIGLVITPKDRFQIYGKGWSWDDYEADYMPERSRFPIYGNVITFKSIKGHLISVPGIFKQPYFNESMIQLVGMSSKFTITRDRNKNKFQFFNSNNVFTEKQIPFVTDISDTIQAKFLTDTLGFAYNHLQIIPEGIEMKYKIFHSQPTDSLLKITMHRSDNFFAEQTLLMVSNERLGLMSDAKIIDTLLKTDYKDLPQKPKWVDGSGLSRYNLISPQDFVAVLEKIKNEFGWNRISTILSTGNDGTLSGYYKNYAGKIYAKTGTLSNNVALSGYIITNKGKQYIFSVLVNNHQASATAIRRAVEKFLTSVMDKY